MSVQTITKSKLENVHIPCETISFVAAQAVADGWKIPFDGEDFKTLFLIQGGATNATLTFLMGDGIQAVTNLEVTVPPGKFVGITLDSGSFKHMTGIHRGYLLAKASALDVKIATVELP